MPIPHRIPVARPIFNGNETKYVQDCLESGWISSVGKYVERFEAEFARHSAARHAFSCANGTCGLHLALLALGVGPGDEVIVPSFTYITSANAVTYCGARAILADCDRDTWTISADEIATRIVSTLWASNPMGARSSAMSVRTRTPAPQSRTTVMATCTTTSACRTRGA